MFKTTNPLLSFKNTSGLIIKYNQYNLTKHIILNLNNCNYLGAGIYNPLHLMG